MMILSTTQYIAHKRTLDIKVQSLQSYLLGIAEKSKALTHVRLAINGDQKGHFLEDHL